MRVVASVGTDHHPFERMFDWLGDAQQQLRLDVFVQRGATPPRAGVDSADYVSADELAALMRAADAVVCHGGPGTMALARQCGHRPIVLARNPALGEHVDDHQMRYVAKLAADGTVDAVDDVDQLIKLLSTARPRVPVGDADREHAAVISQFSCLVNQLVSGSLPRRRWRDRVRLRREA